MTHFRPPQLVSDYSDFGRQQVLRDALRSGPGDCRLFSSPDRRHLFIWLLRQRRLLSFPRLAADVPLPGAYLEQSWRDSPQLCGLLFPHYPQDCWLLCLVWENGRADVWSPPRGPSAKSWLLLQSLELCNSPRARVVSVCGGGAELVWCEQRAPSSPYMYCICRRPLRLCGQQQVTLGSMKIVLHHIPLYSMLSSPHHIFMIPDAGSHPLLIYSLLENKMTMTTPTTGLLHSKALTEGDFKKMVLEYTGFLSSQMPTAILQSEVTEDGHLLLMTTSGQIYLVYENGGVRHILDIEMVAEAQIKMQMFEKILVCAVDTTVFLIDINTGRLLAKQLLQAEELFFARVLDTEDVQVLTRNGVFRISSSISTEDEGKSEPSLLDMVYEEACKYYQRRSLSSAKLTVPEIKKGGMFQAPVTLSAILNNYQKNGKSKDQTQYADLLSNINNELQSFVSLELLKTCILNASEEDIEKCCEELVDHEVTRLLQMDIDRDCLIYINSLFSTFPKAAWMSVRNNFQFLQNGDGKLVIRATAELWKKVLSPLPVGSRDSPHNGVYPLFEVLCQSLCTFKPMWLPTFVQHAQDCSGLSWNFSTKDNFEGAPLYKRALSVLGKRKENTTVDLEVEILLCSGRPQAIIQAIHKLIYQQHWARVIEETRKFSQLSPLITKNIFITLLIEFVKHRHLDSYVNQLCEICPEDLTATEILRIVLQNMPKSEAEPPPFSCSGGAHLTVGLLKPLLNKVLQNQIRNEKFPVQTFPPTTPQRTNKSVSRSPVLNGDDLSPTDFYSTMAL
ncbi:Hermansky-Pudlak syndrome 6 protein isoform X1 [Bufo gargarizans]|uniref:Hermansky-Pudlak syndrome 6 protein isoform X1 n=1 Tax=Bufo gargarizans TaxID=30331 RepID=UPI001CF4287B|nr:Hermansky-Pudlak syndrome 6 protein isoform X1 [Bufo gargarizans]